MKKILIQIVMYVGIDCLGFPLYVKHHKEQYHVGATKFFKPYSK